MTVESTTVPHVNSVVPNGDASNGNVIPSSKKSRESDRRRRRRKQKKNNKASRADAEEADVSGASDSKENADPQPQVGFVLTFPPLVSWDWRFSRVCDFFLLIFVCI